MNHGGAPFFSTPLWFGPSIPMLVIDNLQPPYKSWNSNRIRRRASRFLKMACRLLYRTRTHPQLLSSSIEQSSFHPGLVTLFSLRPHLVRISWYNLRSRSLYLSSPLFFFFGKHQFMKLDVVSFDHLTYVTFIRSFFFSLDSTYTYHRRRRRHSPHHDTRHTS